MPWTNPRTWNIGELVTKAIMDTFIRDNQNYLITVNQNDVTGARAIDSTIYQNTDDKARFVSVNIRSNIDDDGAGNVTGFSFIEVDVEGATPPTIRICQVGGNVNLDSGGLTAAAYCDGFWQAFFVVPPGFYYRVIPQWGGAAGATPTLLDWIEWGE